MSYPIGSVEHALSVATDHFAYARGSGASCSDIALVDVEQDVAARFYTEILLFCAVAEYATEWLDDGILRVWY